MDDIDYIAMLVDVEEQHPAIINDKKIDLMQAVYEQIQEAFARSDVVVKQKIHEPFKSMGSILMVGTCIEIFKTSKFAGLLRLADNVDIYPKTNGTIQIAMTFHGLTK